MRVLKTTGSILLYVVLALCVVAAIAFSVSTDEKKSVFGYRFYEVLSGSMRPTIDIGELVIIKMVDPAAVEVGDIVTKAVTQDGSVTLTHRVIDRYTDEESGREMVVTQGDNNTSPDAAIPADAIIGSVVFHLPYAGYAFGIVKGNLPFFIFAFVCVALLFLILPKVLKKNKKAEAEDDPSLLEEQAYDLLDQATELLSRAAAIRLDSAYSKVVDIPPQNVTIYEEKGKRGKQPVMPIG